MERRFDLSAPVIEKIAKHRKLRGDIVMLPDEELKKGGMIRHVVADLDGGEAIALKLPTKFGIYATKPEVAHVTCSFPLLTTLPFSNRFRSTPVMVNARKMAAPPADGELTCEEMKRRGGRGKD
jgi:hypothetical protein